MLEPTALMEMGGVQQKTHLLPVIWPWQGCGGGLVFGLSAEPTGTFRSDWCALLQSPRAWWCQQKQAKETSCVLRKFRSVETTLTVFFNKKAKPRAMGKIEFHLN